MPEIIDVDGRGQPVRFASPELVARMEAHAAKAAAAARLRAKRHAPTGGERTDSAAEHKPLHEGPAMRPAAAAALKHLQDAYRTARPACSDDPRFIRDGLTTAERSELGSICSDCPIRTPCAAYALAARPAAGYWPESAPSRSPEGTITRDQQDSPRRPSASITDDHGSSRGRP